MQKIIFKGAILTLCLTLAACSLPRGAALQSEILKGSEAEVPEFAVYAVNKEFLPIAARWPETGASRHSWVPASAGPSNRIIMAGDTIELIVWDSEENSLLASPGQKSVPLQRLTVSADGSVFIPYLERVEVAGKTPERAREEIQNRLTEVTPAAQVQLALTSGRRNAVSIVGGVNAPGTYPMPDRNYSVLDLISQGGGVSAALQNPQISLQRGGHVYKTSVAQLYAKPNFNTRLRGGDKVILQSDDRYFLSLGATGSESLFPFTKDMISAMDAVSIIGGLSDTRADPKGILILREYGSRAVSADQSRGPSNERVVFTMDLTTADGLFSARKFWINPGDLVLATESPITKVQTIFSLVGGAFGLAKSAGNL